MTCPNCRRPGKFTRLRRNARGQWRLRCYVCLSCPREPVRAFMSDKTLYVGPTWGSSRETTDERTHRDER